MGHSPKEYEMRNSALKKRHAEELKKFDVGIILKLDQKVKYLENNKINLGHIKYKA